VSGNTKNDKCCDEELNAAAETQRQQSAAARPTKHVTAYQLPSNGLVRDFLYNTLHIPIYYTRKPTCELHRLCTDKRKNIQPFQQVCRAG